MHQTFRLVYFWPPAESEYSQQKLKTCLSLRGAPQRLDIQREREPQSIQATSAAEIPSRLLFQVNCVTGFQASMNP